MGRMEPLSENLLHNDHIDPLTVQLTLFVIDTDGRETVALIQAHARRIGWEGGQHNLVIADLPRPRLQGTQQRVADAASPLFSGDVDREVRNMLVSGSWVECIERTPTYHRPRVVYRNQYWVTETPRGEPIGALIRCTELRLQGRRTVF